MGFPEVPFGLYRVDSRCLGLGFRVDSSGLGLGVTRKNGE